MANCTTNCATSVMISAHSPPTIKYSMATIPHPMIVSSSGRPVQTFTATARA